MFTNLSKYFLPEYEFYLDEVKYNRLPLLDESVNLICQDTINASVVDNGVKLLVVRHLYANKGQLFDLSVSFGAQLTFDGKMAADIKWNEIDLAKEFKENGGFVLSNLLSRISMLVAQITSSFGQIPLVLPPMIPESSTVNEKL